jgi:arylsulfatase A-like enzyme
MTMLKTVLILIFFIAFQTLNTHANNGPKTRPNIIFIMADDLGIGDLGCYGQKKIATPEIDKMATEGVRFTQVYAGSSVCAPTRSSIMTGMHNGHNRVRDNIPHGVFLQPDDLTVAEVLKQAGYATGAIGKWSLGNPGSWGTANMQGFDYFYGHLNQDQAHFYYPDYLWENDEIDLLSGNRGTKRNEYTHHNFTKKALSFIDQNKQKPFFLYLAYTLPHFSDFDKNTPETLIVPSDEPYSNKDWPQVEKNYASMVNMIDADVGKIIERIKDLGLDNNTIMFFTSDNGPNNRPIHDVEFFKSNGIYRGYKRDMYEGGIRIPMIVRWPGKIDPGTTNDAVWAFWDFLPTAADLAGLPFQNNTDGISVLPTLLGEKQKLHDYLYWDYGHSRDEFLQAARWKDWKGIIDNSTGKIEIYDLSKDPGEENNLVSERPGLVKQFIKILNEAYVPSNDYPVLNKLSYKK